MIVSSRLSNQLLSIFFILSIGSTSVCRSTPSTFSQPEYFTPPIVDDGEKILFTDIDNDGDGDIVALASNFRTVSWSENRLGESEDDFIHKPSLFEDISDIDFQDLDGDGYPDAIMSIVGMNEVGWRKNRLQLPEGDFGPLISVSSFGERVKESIAADLDGDNKADIISAPDQSGGLLWFRNVIPNEQGFEAGVTIAHGPNTFEELRTIDIDGDTDLDVVARMVLTNGESPLFVLMENRLNTNDGFSDPISITPINNLIDSFALLDVDQDSDVDFVYTSGFQKILGWHENLQEEGTNTYSSRIVFDNNYSGAKILGVSDVDKDSYPDLILGGLGLLRNLFDTEETFLLQGKISGVFEDVQAVFPLDYDEDLDDDLLLAGAERGGIYLTENLLGEGDDPFAMAVQTVNETKIIEGTEKFSLSDLNSDGLIDLLVGREGVGVEAYYQHPFVQSMERAPLLDFHSESSSWDLDFILADDFDLDGDDDLMLGVFSFPSNPNYAGIHYFENQTESMTSYPSFLSAINILPGSYGFIQEADLDNDGDTDILLEGPSSPNLFFLENRLNTPESDFNLSLLIDDPDASIIGPRPLIDIDSDNDLDLVFSESNGFSYEVRVFRNLLEQGDVSFGVSETVAVNIEDVNGVFLSIDIDGDGSFDLLETLSDDAELIWLENEYTESQSFIKNSIFFEEVEQMNRLAVGDIDQDGLSDFCFITERNGGDLYWVRNSTVEGIVQFDSPQLVSRSLNRVLDLRLADMDSDEDPDILVNSAGEGQVTLYENIDSFFEFKSTDEWTSLTLSVFDEPDFFHDETLDSIDINFSSNQMTFGLWESPVLKLTTADDEELLMANWELSTPIEQPSMVPTLRLRTSSDDFSHSHLTVITSAGAGLFSPRYDSTSYRQLIPSDPVRDEYRFAFELLNFDESNAPSGNVSLESLEVDKKVLRGFSNPMTIFSQDLRNNQDAINQWEIQTDTNGFLPQPDIFLNDQGLLIQGREDNSLKGIDKDTVQFGSWSTVTDIPFEADKVYKASFRITSSALEAQKEKVPTFRMRINDSSLNFAQLLNIDSVNQTADVPTLESPSTYEVWFHSPEALWGNMMLLSFDYLYVNTQGASSDDPRISLTLESVEISEYNLDERL